MIAPLAKTRMTEDLMGPMADSVQPEQVSGLVAYLGSEQCELTHEVFSVGGGRIARVFVGLGPGWFGGKGHVPTPEDVVANLDAIRATEPTIIPDEAADEMMAAREVFS